jgi:hypothetical protein
MIFWGVKGAIDTFTGEHWCYDRLHRSRENRNNGQQNASGDSKDHGKSAHSVTIA